MDFTKDDTSHISIDGGSEQLNDAISQEDTSEVDAVADAVANIINTASPGNSTTHKTTPGKERHSLTLDQRRALRRWANVQVIRPSHKACIEWFESQYGLTISQSTVSHSLSPKYARLDGDSQLSGSRLRFGNWPDVEKLVLLWHTDMINRGRQPSNDELVQKATEIFEKLPRYKGERPPNFSPGWVHRFKKRYGLLMRRRRSAGPHSQDGSSPGSMEDLAYLVDALPRIMNVTADTSPALIRETIQRVVSMDVGLDTCAHVRDSVIHGAASQPHMDIAAAAVAAASSSDQHGHSSMSLDGGEQDEDDAELALQKALRQIQQQEEVSVVHEVIREPRMEAGTMTARNGVGAPVGNGYVTHQQQPQQQLSPTQPQQQNNTALLRPEDSIKLTPIPSAGAAQVTGPERPVRCPFCLNTRMLRTIKEAVEHLSTHVVV